LVSESVKRISSWSKNSQLGAAIQKGLEHGSKEIAIVRAVTRRHLVEIVTD
jgi:hypothetical protein